MDPHALIEKRVGETPLQAIERFRAADATLADTPLAYAGRLDPMASGALLVLIGDTCKEQETYHAFDKTYAFSVLLGFESDTGDVLGMPTECVSGDAYAVSDIMQVAEKCTGAFEMQYPVFSSKPVAGKPLFQHVYDGTISDIEIPKANVHIHKMTFSGMETVYTPELIDSITDKIERLQLDPQRTQPGNDFRKDDILAQWRALRDRFNRKHTILHFNARVSSGTYIRALAPTIAEKLGTCGLAYAIHRTHIGDYSLNSR